jgi:hypothetical protein
MAKPRKGESAQEPRRLRVHGLIDAEVRRRLGSYAGAHGVTEGQVIEEALRDRLRGFYFGQREPGASVSYTSPAGEAADVLPIRTTG